MLRTLALRSHPADHGRKEETTEGHISGIQIQAGVGRAGTDVRDLHKDW